jgi:NitT/TauT family transport system substrate-binding protein
MRNVPAILIAIIVLHGSAQAADKIRITAPTRGSVSVSLPLAQKMGFLREEGLDAEFIQVRGATVRAGILNGQIDYYVGFGSMISAAISGLPVKIVACFVPKSPEMLIARPEFNAVQALKRRSIMVSGPGGDPRIIAGVILKHFGLDPDKDVKFVHGGAAERRLAALGQSLVDATIVGPPLDFQAKKLGLHVLVRLQDLINYPSAGLVSSIRKIKERPDEIKRIIKAAMEANRYIRREREGTIQFLMEWEKIDKEIATATYDSMRDVYSEDGSLPEDGMKLVLDEAIRATKVKHRVGLNDLVDLSILKQAQRELGIEGK